MSINWRPMKENLRPTHTVKGCAAFKNNKNLHLLTLSSESRASQSAAQTLQPDRVSSEHSSGPDGLWRWQTPDGSASAPCLWSGHDNSVYRAAVRRIWAKRGTSTENNICNTGSAANSLWKEKYLTWKIYPLHELHEKRTQNIMHDLSYWKWTWTYTECRPSSLLYTV